MDPKSILPSALGDVERLLRAAEKRGGGEGEGRAETQDPGVVQGSTNRREPGLVNFVPALAYHFCLNLLAAFTQPGARLLVEPCS